MSNPITDKDEIQERPWKRQKGEQEEEKAEQRRGETRKPTSAAVSAFTLTRDPISVILPFLTLHEFACSAASVSSVWYQTARTMRSRRDQCTIKYFNETNQPNQVSPQHQPLYFSSLRRHITHLQVHFFSSQTIAPVNTVSVTDSLLPSHQQQLNWVNAISHPMSHLLTLTVKFILTRKDASDVTISPESIKWPPHLRCLKLETAMYPHAKINMYDSAVVEKWLLRMFTSITGTLSLCSSLRILESLVHFRTGYPISVVSSLHKLTALRRLSLRAPNLLFASNQEFIDAIRAISQLSEFEGNTSEMFSYLLRSPCQQSYRRLGESALVLTKQSTIIIGQPKLNEPSGMTNPMVHPDALVASSAHSLIDLAANLLISPTFLPRFTRLRYLSISCWQDQEWSGPDGPTPLPAPFEIEDLISSLSQCITLERLIIDWHMLEGEFSESHLERILTPLLRLDYLSLIGAHFHRVRSLSFLTRHPHLMSGLRYLNFQGRLASLSEYCSIYSLTQLRLLCLDDGLAGDENIEAWKSESGCSRANLDELFRPRHQLYGSYLAYPGSNGGDLLGPGQLPHDFCPHLRHFIQSSQHRSVLKEWKEMIEEAEREREEELLTMP